MQSKEPQTRGKMQNERLQTRSKMQNENYRLQSRGKMRDKTAGNTSGFV